MEWIKVEIETTEEGIEGVGAVLTDFGLPGYQTENVSEMKNFLENNPQSWDYIDDELISRENTPPIVIFYVSADSTGREVLLGIKSQLSRLNDEDYGIDFGSLELRTKEVDDTDWLDKWRDYYKPFKAGIKTVICPMWEDYKHERNEILFKIDPGHVFGTGQHESTRMCIEALEASIKQGDIVLDIGCGSGILSIIALLLGAAGGDAIDIDSAAIETVYQNYLLNKEAIPEEISFNRSKNHISTPGYYNVFTGNILKGEKNMFDAGKYDVVISNIVADVIIALVPIVPGFIKRGGIYISSGIIKERAQEVGTAILNQGFELVEEKEMGEWCALVHRKI